MELQEQAQRDKQPRKRKDVVCLVCGKRYRTIRAEHLRGHGLTRDRYRRIYGRRAASTADDRINGSNSSGDPHLDLVGKLADRVADSAGFLDALASECADHILSAAPLRAQVAFAAAQVIQARVAIHADAVGRLSRVTTELDEPWRITAGGPNGKPTPTKDLVMLAGQAHAEIVKAEEMVLKAARLALDERKLDVDANLAPGFVYSGAAEGISIPKDLSAPDREALRALMGNLTKYVGATREARKAITVAAEVVTVSGKDVPGSVSPQPLDAPEHRVVDPLIRPPSDPLAVTTTPVPARRRRRRRSQVVPPVPTPPDIARGGVNGP